tara:strand:- start:2811 stop:3542 length:732 start_codon:yes stop_codon:yes gene_type:complete
MNLAIDIGNTSLKKASFTSLNVSKVKNINYSKNNFNKLLFSIKKDLHKYDKVYICSVVPEINKIIKKKLSKSTIHFIDKHLLKSYVHKSVNLKQLGVDRLINVVSVNHIFPKNKNFIIIDLGTATTLDLIINSQYFGGAILPGLKTSYLNLISLASGINSISFQELNDVIGKDTKGALLSGFNTGYKLMIEAYIKKLISIYKLRFKVIFTGGYASNILNKQTKYLYKEDLTLLGIAHYHNLTK